MHNNKDHHVLFVGGPMCVRSSDESTMANGRHFQKSFNRDNLAEVRPIAVKFGMMTQFDQLKSSDGHNFEFSKIEDGGRPPSQTPLNLLISVAV